MCVCVLYSRLLLAKRGVLKFLFLGHKWCGQEMSVQERSLKTYRLSRRRGKRKKKLPATLWGLLRYFSRGTSKLRVNKAQRDQLFQLFSNLIPSKIFLFGKGLVCISLELISCSVLHGRLRSRRFIPKQFSFAPYGSYTQKSQTNASKGRGYRHPLRAPWEACFELELSHGP